MAKLENVDWVVVRYKYEHTDEPTLQICRDHDISPSTLRDRVWRWGWTPRRPWIPRDGPAPLGIPQVARGAPPLQLPQIEAIEPSPPGAPPAAQAASGEQPHAGNDIPTAERLQGAVVAVLANIEAIVARAGAGRAHASENERAARSLAALTRTLRELKAFQTHPEESHADDTVDDIDEFRRALARKIDALVAARGGGVRDGAEPQGE